MVRVVYSVKWVTGDAVTFLSGDAEAGADVSDERVKTTAGSAGAGKRGTSLAV